jgi:hypothetical protein
MSPPVPQTISCPACGAPVEPEAGSATATCRFCRAVVRVPGGPAGNAPLSMAVLQAAVPMPRGITIEETPTGFRIVRRWFQAAVILLFVFLVVWFGFLAFFYRMASAGGAPTLFYLFPLIHVAVGVGIGYWALCGLVNRTTIECAYGVLGVRHHPLPWPGNRSFATADLAQLYVKEKVTHNSKGGVRVTYGVFALGRDGRTSKVVAGLSDVDQAFCIEQEIERRLRIGDRPVVGEVHHVR